MVRFFPYKLLECSACALSTYMNWFQVEAAQPKTSAVVVPPQPGTSAVLGAVASDANPP